MLTAEKPHIWASLGCSLGPSHPEPLDQHRVFKQIPSRILLKPLRAAESTARARMSLPACPQLQSNARLLLIFGTKLKKTHSSHTHTFQLPQTMSLHSFVQCSKAESRGRHRQPHLPGLAPSPAYFRVPSHGKQTPHSGANPSSELGRPLEQNCKQKSHCFGFGM